MLPWKKILKFLAKNCVLCVVIVKGCAKHGKFSTFPVARKPSCCILAYTARKIHKVW